MKELRLTVNDSSTAKKLLDAGFSLAYRIEKEIDGNSITYRQGAEPVKVVAPVVEPIVEPKKKIVKPKKKVVKKKGRAK